MKNPLQALDVVVEEKRVSLMIIYHYLLYGLFSISVKFVFVSIKRQATPTVLFTCRTEASAWLKDSTRPWRDGPQSTRFFLICYLLEERLGVFEISGVESLGEPTVDLR